MKKNIFSIWVFLKKIKRFLSNIFIFFRWRVKFLFYSILNPIFNTTLKSQNKDYKSIPIIIINFNQLEYLKKLIFFLQKHNYKNIVIIDNLSTYKPLLEYYRTIENSVDIIRNTKNEGHRVFWKNKAISKKYGKGYYVITDSDIVPNSSCPDDFLLNFKNLLDSNSNLSKVGFSLRIDNIPNSNLHKEKILNWEKRFWMQTNKDGHFIAEIDTTFALYRPLNQFEHNYFYKALRLKSPFLAIHGGWYIDHYNLNKEQQYYMKTASKSASWKVDSTGDLVSKHYEK